MILPKPLIRATAIAALVLTSVCNSDKLEAGTDAPAEVLSDISTALIHHSKVPVVPADERMSFNEHIQPILSASCFHSHGPHTGTRLPDTEPFRLDTKEGAFTLRVNGQAVIKGYPDNSYLVQLMESTDKELVTPPDPTTHVHGTVTDPAKIVLVCGWVKAGAIYEKHWAYIPPQKADHANKHIEFKSSHGL